MDDQPGDQGEQRGYRGVERAAPARRVYGREIDCAPSVRGASRGGAADVRVEDRWPRRTDPSC